jgi:endonuclease/exonuclease/phosphatase family metal-dependent hydrolase
MARLCAGIERVAPGAACVIGGDLNTKALPPEEGSWFAELAVHEPLFAHAARAGFDWRAANTPAPTQRTGPAGKPHPPFRKLDWLLTRGVHAENPRVVAALDGEGRAISDHEMVAADIVF